MCQTFSYSKHCCYHFVIVFILATMPLHNSAAFFIKHVSSFYRKRKVREIEEWNRPAGNEKWKIKGRQTFKRAKQRRH